MLGLAGVVLGIGSLGSLVTVVTLNNIDALSTVALVLAVLAFVIQIIVFIAQTTTASRQAVDVQAVNAQTRELLAEVRTNTQQTNATLSEQFTRVLDGAFSGLQKAVAEPAEETGGPTEEADLAAFRGRVLQEVEEAKEAARGEIARLVESSTPKGITIPYTSPPSYKVASGKGTAYMPDIVVTGFKPPDSGT